MALDRAFESQHRFDEVRYAITVTVQRGVEFGPLGE
jgi:hypothetical protein